MPPVIGYKTPAWADPQEASVTDSWFQWAARKLGGLVGADDPASQVMGLAGAMETGPVSAAKKAIKALRIGREVPVPAEAGYVYHATNAERLREIAESGKLRTHKPWEFTEQNVWPDGSIKKRSYFGASPEHLWQFAPETGEPVILRTAKTPVIRRESTGDLFSEKPIAAKALEYFGEDGAWHPVTALKAGLMLAVIGGAAAKQQGIPLSAIAETREQEQDRLRQSR